MNFACKDDIGLNAYLLSLLLELLDDALVDAAAFVDEMARGG